MKCLLIDKDSFEAYVELPDGMIVSIPSSDVSNSSIGDCITISTKSLINPPQNSVISNLNFIDFF